MAGHGNTLPKDSSTRIRRNADTVPTTQVSPGGLYGPDLPPPAGDWPDATKRWWWTWRRSAQAKTFTPTDWEFLLDTALLHARLWQGDSKVAAEIRLRVSKFGATVEDRIRLRLQIVTPGESQEGSETPSRYGHLRAVPPSA